MAVLNLRAAFAAVWLLGIPACSVLDPIVAADEYTVKDDGAGRTELTVKITGGDGVSRLRQRDVILDYMLDMSREPSRDAAAFDAMLELENLFQLNGYHLVEVKYRVERKAGTKVFFTIEQHKRVLLESIQIVGGSEKEEDLLRYFPRRKIDSFGLGEELYVAADVDTLRRGIETHYKSIGYLDATARIVGPVPAITKEIEKVSVQIHVEPLQRYVIRRIDVAPELQELLDDHAKQIAEWKAKGSKEPRPGPDEPEKLRIGAPFISRDVQDRALELRRYFRRWGHPAPEILTTITKDTSADKSTSSVSVRLHGEPGKKAIVGEIEIVKVEREDGSKGFVSAGNIRDRIQLKVGERFDGEKEEQSLVRLYRSGLFRGAETEYVPLGDGRIKVVFKMRDTTRYLIQPLLGAGSYERIRAGLEFEMLSLFGTDFDFNSKAIISDRGHRAVASVADSEFLPDLFGLDTTLTIAIDDFRREEPSFTDGATGLTPSISKLWNQQWSTRVGYTIRDHGSVFSSVVDPGAQIGNYREGSLVFEVAYDSRRNPVMPKDGTRVALQHKWADDAFGGEVSFHRTRLSITKIFPMTESSRFVLRGEAGILIPDAGLDQIPIQEKFFNGGETTVRSFREDQLAGQGLRDVNGLVIGGGFRNVLNAEVRWAPSWQLLSVVETEFAVFGDAGNLGLNYTDYKIGDLKYGVGAGIRFLLPIGPVRFDYTHNPDREPGERDWTFHFSIGHAF